MNTVKKNETSKNRTKNTKHTVKTNHYPKNKSAIPSINPLIMIIVAIIIGLTYTTLTSKPNNDIQTIQIGIAEKIVRFHVIANSDSAEDQSLKLKVKDAVVAYTAPLLENSSSISESEQILVNESEEDDYDKETNIRSPIFGEQEQTGRGHYCPFAQREAIGGFVRRWVRHHALRPFVWKMGEYLEQRPLPVAWADPFQKGC